MNLIKNAMKFTQNGQIEVFATYDENPESTLTVKVKDTGVGIAAQDMDQLFTRFGKLQRTATINSEGLGLGLTIVKQIVESAGGEVTVFSEGVGKGSTFTVKMNM